MTGHTIQDVPPPRPAGEIDWPFLREIAAVLRADARRTDAEIKRQGLGETTSESSARACALVPSLDVGPEDVVILDESRTPYQLAWREGEWIVLHEVGGNGVSRAHIDDLVERTKGRSA